MMIYPTPSIFRVPDFFYYPSDNFPDFEYWFMQNVTESEFSYGDRVYLPIIFTSYLKRNQFGKNVSAIGMLQDFVDKLPADKKYFCICQYDDGVPIDWKGKDIIVFSMSGKGNIGLPLVCQPHPFKFENVEKDILCSFVGRITDPMRQTLYNWGRNRRDVYVSTETHSLHDYCKILARSKFVLCPRGYGLQSFRCGEAMQYGAIPMVFDNGTDRTWEQQFLLSFSFEGGLRERDLDFVPNYCSEWFNHWFDQDIKSLYEKWFTFDSVKKTIFEALWNLQ